MERLKQGGELANNVVDLYSIRRKLLT
jgi:hypothetical protein